MIEYMGTGYGSTRFALITEQANATWKLKSFKIEEKRFTPKTSCGQHIPIDKDYNSNTTPLFTASTASTTVSVPATPTPKRVVITGSISAGAAPAQFGASLSFSTTVGKVYTIYLENVSLETTNLAPSYQNYIGYAVVNHPADAGDAGKMLANGSLGYTSCYKGYAITFVARATTTWLVLGGMVAAQDAGQAASVSVQLQKLRIVGSQPIRRTVQLLADKRYRYQYNGMEVVDDNNLNVYITANRILSSDYGRWWQIDPKFEKRYSLTPYNSMSNNPIIMVDPKGDHDYYSLGGTGVMIAIEPDMTSMNDNFYRIDPTNGNVVLMQSVPIATGNFGLLPDATKVNTVNTQYNQNSGSTTFKAESQVVNSNGLTPQQQQQTTTAGASASGAVTTGAAATGTPIATGAPGSSTWTSDKNPISTITGPQLTAPVAPQAANANLMLPLGTLVKPATGTTAVIAPGTLPPNVSKTVEGAGEPIVVPVTTPAGNLVQPNPIPQ